MTTFKTVAFIVMALSACIGTATEAGNESHVQARATSQDLANALVQMARATRTPLIAELAWPLPHVSADNLSMNPDGLNALLKQAPGYEWRIDGKVVHFYDLRLRTAKYNFLNRTFPQFTVPSNLSDFKLWFPGRAIGLMQGYTSEGGMTTGFGDAELKKDALRTTTLRDVTPLQVLEDVAGQSPTFYTVLVFPSSRPSRHQAATDTVWQWGSLREAAHPIYTQPPH